MALSNADILIAIRAERKQLTKDLRGARRQISGFSSGVQKQANAIATSLGAAFAGQQVISGLKTGIMKIADFEFQMDKVAAVSGATAEEVKRLTDNALELGAKSKFTATEIGKLQEELARLGFGTDQIVNMTDASRKLAQVADAELGEAAKVLGKQLNAFNLSSEQSADVANIMAESFSKSALDLEQFSVAMSFAGAAGKAFGLDLADVTAMVGVLIDNGIQASKAGSGLRDIFADLTTKGLSLEYALNKVNQSEDGFATALDLVGKTSANQLLILAQNQERVKSLGGELKDTNKELNTMVHIMEDNLATDLKLLESAFDGLVMQGSALNGVFRGTVQFLTGLVNKVSEYSTELTRALRVMQGFATLGTSELFFAVAGSIKEVKKEAEGVFVGPMPNKTVAGFDVEGFINDTKEATDNVKKLKQEVQEILISPSFENTVSRDDLREALGLDTSFFTPDLEQLAEESWGEEVAAHQSQQFKTIRDQMQSEAEMFNAMADEILASSVSAFIGTLAGPGDITRAFRAMFDVIGDGLQQLGKAMVSLGFAKLALSKFPYMGAPALLAAGAAALAAGSLIKQGSSNVAAAGSGNIGGGSGGTTLQGQTNNLNLSGEFVVRGADLVYTLNRQNQLEGRTHG
ncbi:MAG: phage tail tape measure protein [bacterium]|nr:phage tail tape measure protein [bacterium]